MSTSYGFNSVVQTFSPTSLGLPSVSPFISARVIDIILDDKHKDFKNQGAWDSIGTIQFKPVYSFTQETSKNAFFFAKPFFSNIKHYPLKNEIVLIVFLPNQEDKNKSTGTYYYIDNINIWSSIHHNASPDELNLNNLPEEQKRDYIQTSAGASRRITDESSEIKLGDFFKEKSNIHSLLPYEGDTIIEGRWGQSIRFGSTVSNGGVRNLWSSNGENGDPLILIRNNQSPQAPKEGWVPILEDINLDGSSIYLTSYQNIPIIVSSTNIASFNTAFENKSPERIFLSNIEPNIPTGSNNNADDNLDTNINLPGESEIFSSSGPDILPDEEILLPGESDIIDTPTPDPPSSDAEDFWSLLCICTFEDSDDQGRADVAQSIYNRAGSKKYSYNSGKADTIAKVIKANNQYEPAFGKSNGESSLGMKTSTTWKNIKNKDTAISALKSHKRKVTKTHKVKRGDTIDSIASLYGYESSDILKINNITDISVGQILILNNEATELKKVYKALKNLINQQNSKSFIQGRTDFLSIILGDVDQRNRRVGAGPYDSTGKRGTFVMREYNKPNNVFGWAYNYKDNTTYNPPDQTWWDSFSIYF